MSTRGPKAGSKKKAGQAQVQSELAKTASAMLAGISNTVRRLSGGTVSPSLVEEEHGDGAVLLSRPHEVRADPQALPQHMGTSGGMIQPQNQLAEQAQGMGQQQLQSQARHTNPFALAERMHASWPSEHATDASQPAAAGSSYKQQQDQQHVATAHGSGLKAPAGAAARQDNVAAEPHAPTAEAEYNDVQDGHGEAEEKEGTEGPAGAWLARHWQRCMQEMRSFGTRATSAGPARDTLAGIFVLLLAVLMFHQISRAPGHAPAPTMPELASRVAGLSGQVAEQQAAMAALEAQQASLQAQVIAAQRGIHNATEELHMLRSRVGIELQGLRATVANHSMTLLTAAAQADQQASAAADITTPGAAMRVSDGGELPKCHPAALAAKHGPLVRFTVTAHSPAVGENLLAMSVYRTVSRVLKPNEGGVHPAARGVASHEPGGTCLPLDMPPPGQAQPDSNPFLQLDVDSHVRLHALSFIYPQPGHPASSSPAWQPASGIASFRLDGYMLSDSGTGGDRLAWSSTVTLDLKARQRAADDTSGCWVFLLKDVEVTRLRVTVLRNAGGTRHTCFPQLLMHAAAPQQTGS